MERPARLKWAASGRGQMQRSPAPATPKGLAGLLRAGHAGIVHDEWQAGPQRRSTESEAAIPLPPLQRRRRSRQLPQRDWSGEVALHAADPSWLVIPRSSSTANSSPAPSDACHPPGRLTGLRADRPQVSHAQHCAAGTDIVHYSGVCTVQLHSCVSRSWVSKLSAVECASACAGLYRRMRLVEQLLPCPAL